VEANLTRLNLEFRLPYVDDLIALKMNSAEKATLATAEIEYHAGEYQRLVSQLELSVAESQLRDEPEAQSRLNDLLIRLRIQEL
jgi:hypothetical protein